MADKHEGLGDEKRVPVRFELAAAIEVRDGHLARAALLDQQVDSLRIQVVSEARERLSLLAKQQDTMSSTELLEAYAALMQDIVRGDEDARVACDVSLLVGQRLIPGEYFLNPDSKVLFEVGDDPILSLPVPFLDDDCALAWHVAASPVDSEDEPAVQVVVSGVAAVGAGSIHDAIEDRTTQKLYEDADTLLDYADILTAIGEHKGADELRQGRLRTAYDTLAVADELSTERVTAALFCIERADPGGFDSLLESLADSIARDVGFSESTRHLRILAGLVVKKYREIDLDIGELSSQDVSDEAVELYGEMQRRGRNGGAIASPTTQT